MKQFIALLLLPLVMACGQAEAETKVPGFFAEVVGNWDGTQRMMGTDLVFDASYKVHVTEENMLVHEFTSNWNGAFAGREELTFDADGTLHAVWSDTAESEEMVSTGKFDDATKTLTMTGKGPNWSNPEEIVTFEHVTVYKDGSSNYTMTMISDDGTRNEVMWINMVKRND
ncbi:MAG: DUF1579 family protein [Planctomycetes bacterium]|nr:DUF1579 family protein [Planctomycetota bacterium]